MGSFGVNTGNAGGLDTDFDQVDNSESYEDESDEYSEMESELDKKLALELEEEKLNLESDGEEDEKVKNGKKPGKPSLTSQLRMFGRKGFHQESFELLKAMINSRPN